MEQQLKDANIKITSNERKKTKIISFNHNANVYSITFHKEKGIFSKLTITNVQTATKSEIKKETEILDTVSTLINDNTKT
jgi:hypothetical protein